MNTSKLKLLLIPIVIFFNNYIIDAQNEQAPIVDPARIWELPATHDQPNIGDAIIPFSIRQEQLDHNYRENELQEDDPTWSLTDGYGGSCDRDCNVAPYDNAPPSAACDGGNYLIPYVITIVRECGSNNLPDGWTDAADAIGDLDAVISQVNSYYSANGMPMQLTKAIYHGLATEADGSTRIITDATLCSFSGGSGTGSDNNYANGIDIPNVLNIYVAEVVNGSTGCNGFAFLPTGPTAPNRAVMQASCFNSFACPPPNPAMNPGRNGVLIHEVGHYLGLYHTHHPYEVNSNPPSPPRNECPDGSNGCTAGDFIADTGADPNLEDPCVIEPSPFPPLANCSNHVVSSCPSPCGTPYATATTATNVMSYNRIPLVSGSGPGTCQTCRSMFTDCQKAKMIDALLCSRNKLCDRSADTDLAAGAAGAVLEICIGDPVPTFMASSSCFDWYDGLGSSAQLLLSGTSSFQPPVGPDPGEVNNQVPGSYVFYLGDANEYNPDCRTAVTIVVLEDSGNGITVSNTSISGTSTIDLSTTGTVLDDGIIGWLVSTTVPPAINNQGDLDNYIATGTTYESTSNDTDYSLEVTCAGAEIYYASPVISLASSPAPAAYEAALVGQANISPTENVLPINVFQLPANATLTQVCVNLDYNPCESFATMNDLSMSLQGPNGTTIVLESFFDGSSNVPTPTTIDFCFVDDGTGYTGASSSGCNTSCFTGSLESDNSFDIFNAVNPNGVWNFTLNDGNNLGFYPCEINIELVFDMASFPITFPDITYSDCVIGMPVEITCLAATPVELISFTGVLTNEIVTLDWQTITEQNNDYFTLYRSGDGRNFLPITQVDGHGTTLIAQQYQFLDKQPLAGLNYYRLEQTDYDGTTVYVGNIVVVNNDKTIGGIQIQPNPIHHDELSLMATVETSGIMDLQIYSMTGALVFQNQAAVGPGENGLSFKIADLPEGVYLLKTVQNNQVFTARFVKTE